MTGKNNKTRLCADKRLIDGFLCCFDCRRDVGVVRLRLDPSEAEQVSEAQDDDDGVIVRICSG